MMIDIKNCARCGHDHTKLEFKPFTVPVDIGDQSLTYFSMCPNLQEPILMGFYTEVEWEVGEKK